MRSSGRRLDPEAGPSAVRRAVRWLAAALAFAGANAAAGLACARDLAVQGTPMKGFARIELRFDQATKVQVKTTNNVLVLGFSGPTRVASERLAAEIGGYVSVVRRDPDGSGLRLALARPVKANVLEAGERVFVDLLPPDWNGLPPGLPPEVVAELAERARIAEAKLRTEETRRAAVRRPVLLRVAELPTLTRLVFEPPPGTPMRTRPVEGGMEAIFEGRLVLDLAGSRPKAATGIAEFATSGDETTLSARIKAAPGYTVSAFAEGETVVVDLAKPGRTAAVGAGEASPPQARPPAPASGAESGPKPASGASPAVPVREAGLSPDPGMPAESSPPVPRREPGAPPVPAGIVTPVFQTTDDGDSILFPFPRPTAAAAFERAGRLTLVFDAPDRLDPGQLGALPADLAVQSLAQEPGFSVVTLRIGADRKPRLVPEGDGWRLALAAGGAPADELKVVRSTGRDGQSQVLIPFPAAAAVHWLPGGTEGRLAVVTATGRPQALGTGRGFVEYAVLPSLQGIAIEARADDLSVTLGRGGVVVSTPAGLAVSGQDRATPNATVGPPLVIERDLWMQDGSGDPLARSRALVDAAAAAPRSGRGEARARFARFLLANGMAPEARSVLALARSEDAVFARRRDAIMLAAITAAGSRRFDEARTLLGAEPLTDDREADLWRAAVDAGQRRWTAALAGFGKAREVLGRYPDELQGSLWLDALRSALKSGDLGVAETTMVTIDRLAPGSIPADRHDMARAVLDEAAGRSDAALKAYERLARDATRPIEAEAVLRATILGRRLGRVPAEDAVLRLETLSVAWRGDEVELGTLVELGALYAQAGRWRDMFTVARRADASFPDHEETRALHDDAARRFEGLFLGNDMQAIAAADIVALYYDFKDLAPIGRRGDEIVRRLADKLVGLDLLEQAAELLQYQVDRRLAGAARAAVATRLAVIRLMDGKPAQALGALRATRVAELPERLRRFRLLVEAQAQADLTRIDLALEILDGQESAEAARLRAGILFGGRRWREAGEASEALVGLRWQGDAGLSDTDRADVIRAALADILADEPIGLERLRSKFGRKMADSPDAKSFEALFVPGAIRTREFRNVLRDAAKIDTLRRLLTEWTASGGEAGPDAVLPEVKAALPTRQG